MNRLAARLGELASRGEKALIVYLMAGDPSPDATPVLVEAAARAGADVVELGIPFSDPLADGPVIQAAGQRALRAGTTVARVLSLAARIREASPVPLVFMTYYNPVLRYGPERFVADAARAGADGLIVPDLPVEEAGGLRDLADAAGLALVPLVAPTTPEGRIATIAASARGFIYCVSLTGVTGVRDRLPPELAEFTARVRRHARLPVALGFGISGPEHVAAVAPLVDAVVVGSALVKAVA
ncbi:MAG: tryptophan synthase subunit alpha, partial [Firmicutes bacterium]|nr:tryptophan synthase subunit alpha [Bacillota bacterium]